MPVLDSPRLTLTARPCHRALLPLAHCENTPDSTTPGEAGTLPSLPGVARIHRSPSPVTMVLPTSDVMNPTLASTVLALRMP